MDLVKKAKRTIVLVIGLTLVIFGILLLFLPGSGTLLIALGFAVLASEFWWARKLWIKAKQTVK